MQRMEQRMVAYVGGVAATMTHRSKLELLATTLSISFSDDGFVSS